jgi:hypothetical protein
VNRDGAGVAKLGAFETIITDDDMIKVAVLEYHAGQTDRDAFAAIGAFILYHDIGAVITTINGPLGTNFHAFAALRTYPRSVYSRLREMGLDFQAGLFGIYFIVMTDGANLHTQTASGAFS